MRHAKNLLTIVPLWQIKILFVAIIFIAFSCKKTTTPSNTIDNLFTEKIDNIQRKEPVLLSFGNTNFTESITWQITPNNNIEIEKVGVYATLKFVDAGVYKVVAKTSNKQATYIVTVLNILYNEFGSNFGLTASKIVGVNQNEDVLFTLHNCTAPASQIIWTATNASSINVAADKQSAIISFASGNANNVTVVDGTNKQSRTIFLNNPTSNNAIDTVPFIFGDKIFIAPSVQTDAFGVKSLNLLAKTNYNYQCNTDKILSVADNTSYVLSYGGVVMSSTICSAVTQPTSINSFVNMSVGLHTFTIHYENKTFTGTIDVSALGVFTFNFTNNNLANIFPLQVQ